MRYQLQPLASRLILLVVLLCAAPVMQAQSLYQDAKNLVEANQKNSTVTISLETDTISNILLYQTGLQEADQVLHIFKPGIDSFAIRTEGKFFITNKSGTPFKIGFHYDTLSVIPQDTTLTYFRIDLQNTANRFSASSSFKIGFTNIQIAKYYFDEIQSILQANLLPRQRPSQPLSLNFTANGAAVEANPFLGQLLPKFNIQIPSWRDSIALVDSISTKVKKLEGSPQHKALGLLYQNEGFSAKYFPSIQDVVKDYAEPAISNIQAVQATVQNITASKAQSGELDFTTTLITGLADFVLERAQEEFNYSFMRNLRKKLDDIEELSVLFPESKEFLANIDLPNYRSLLTSAQSAFVQDLDLIGVHLPQLLKLDKYRSLDTVPAIFNLLTIYNMVDFTYRGVAIDTIIPLAYTALVDRESEINKQTNLVLARKLIGSSELQNFKDGVKTHTEKLDTTYRAILRRQINLISKFSQWLFKDDLTEEQDQKIKSLWLNTSTALSTQYQAVRNNWDTLSVIPEFLEGRPDYDYILAAPRLRDYEKYFGQLPDSIQLVGAGLELSKSLLSGTLVQPSKARLLRRWNLEIERSFNNLDLIIAEFTRPDTLSILRKELADINQENEDLKNATLADISFWKSKKAREFDTKALEFLAGTLTTRFFFAQLRLDSSATIHDTIVVRRNYLNRVRTRIEERLDTMQMMYSPNEESPLLARFRADTIETVPLYLSPEDSLTVLLINDAGNLRSQLTDIRQKYAGSYLKAGQNAKNLSRAMEFTAHLMYCFKGDQSTGKKWLTARQFNEVMSNKPTREAFLGLMYQRLSSLDLGSDLSSDGIAMLATSLINTISKVNTQQDSLRVKRLRNEDVGFKDYYPFLRATISFLNDAITTPLFTPKVTNSNSFGAALPLTAQYGILRDIPTISNQTLDLFDNISKREYGPAISNLVQLFEVFAFKADEPCDLLPKDSCSQLRRVKTNILKYGTFFAGIASAKEPGDISAAFSAAAVPQGSSRTKRVNKYDFGLNAYFGGSFGRENIQAYKQNGISPINHLSLSVPLGFSFSFKTGRNASGSWTVFTPIIDLGVVTSFRINDPNAQDLPELKLENLIAPGVIALYNIGNTPFSVGAGWQYGPLAREITINGVTTSSTAYRWNIFFGVDVPIFDFYTREWD